MRAHAYSKPDQGLTTLLLFFRGLKTNLATNEAIEIKNLVRLSGNYNMHEYSVL